MFDLNGGLVVREREKDFTWFMLHFTIHILNKIGMFDLNGRLLGRTKR